MLTQRDIAIELERRGYDPRISGGHVELTLPGAIVRVWPTDSGVLAMGRSAQKVGHVSGVELGDIPDFVAMFRERPPSSDWRSETRIT